MNRPEGLLELQVDSILSALRGQQELRCREILAAAEGRARQALDQSRQRLRKRLREAIAEERQRRRHELHVASSRIQSRAREEAYELYERVLEQAWPRLSRSLEQRWTQADDRQAWCELVVEESARTLTQRQWTVEHPVAWAVEDADALTAMMANRKIPAPVFREDPTINAGLRVRADSACVDGTVAGILARRPYVEALLLATWERQRHERSSDG